jgi:hypothetical protein
MESRGKKILRMALTQGPTRHNESMSASQSQTRMPRSTPSVFRRNNSLTKNSSLMDTQEKVMKWLNSTTRKAKSKNSVETSSTSVAVAVPESVTGAVSVQADIDRNVEQTEASTISTIRCRRSPRIDYRSCVRASRHRPEC